jgi:quercetin dioxygenase-like cupin family protein
MSRVLVALAVVAGVLVACGGGGAAAPASSPAAKAGPVTKFKNTLPGLTATGAFDVIQMVQEFAPGAATPKHTHPTPNLATVFEGAITVKLPGEERSAQTGQTIVEPLNTPCQAVNAGAGRALMLATYPVAPGGAPSRPVAGEPVPALPNKTLYRYVLQSPAVTGGYDIVQLGLEFAPGAQTPRQKHGGPGILTVIDGQLTLRVDGDEKTYSPGDSFVESPGQTLQVLNRGASAAVVVGSYLLPAGAQLTTNV